MQCLRPYPGDPTRLMVPAECVPDVLVWDPATHRSAPVKVCGEDVVFADAGALCYEAPWHFPNVVAYENNYWVNLTSPTGSQPPAGAQQDINDTLTWKCVKVEWVDPNVQTFVKAADVPSTLYFYDVKPRTNRTYGPVAVGNLSVLFRDTGAFNPQRAYEVGDVVFHNKKYHANLTQPTSPVKPTNQRWTTNPEAWKTVKVVLS